MNQTAKHPPIILLLALLGQLLFPAAAAEFGTNSLLSAPLSLADAINIALRQNPNILRAQKDVAAAEGIAIQTRALAIPKVRSTGHYNAIAHSDVDKPNISNTVPGFTFGTDQSWGTDIRLDRKSVV